MNTFFKYTCHLFLFSGEVILDHGGKGESSFVQQYMQQMLPTHHLPEGILKGTSDSTLHGDLPLWGPDGRLKFLLQWVRD